MQVASNEYKASMKKPFRNRGYIRATIGVFNQEAQNGITFSEDNPWEVMKWWSNPKKLFQGHKVTKEYATRESNYVRLDGSMYFAPKQDSNVEIYNNGIVTSDNELIFDFDDYYDIKGFTINFGITYPLKIQIETWGKKNIIRDYTLNSPLFVTEDLFEGVNCMDIIIVEMRPNQLKRIHELNCGIVNTFSNNEVIDFSWKEYVSSIADSIPSQDMSLTVNNTDMYYSPNNPESTLAFLELGQNISVQFGYDVSGNGDIEWIKPISAYLKTWSADEKQAKFTATDIFDYTLNGNYNKGKYYEDGISLYDLALDVFTDAGMTDDRLYDIDPYLKNVIVYNPLPNCTHAEALQIIANTGRCALSSNRDNKISIGSSFVPTTTVTTNSLSEYGSLKNLLSASDKHDFAIKSKGYNKVNGTLYFYNGDSSQSGYVSSAYYANNKWVGTTPEITLQFETAWSFYGLGINFKNVYPQEMIITTYNGSEVVETKTHTVNTLNWVTDDEFKEIDKITIKFTKGSDKSRLCIDSILISNLTAYTITRNNDILGTATAQRNDKIKSISVSKYKYRKTDELKELGNGEVTLPGYDSQTLTVEFSNDCYGYEVSFENGWGSIIDSSAHYCTIEVNNGSMYEETVKYTIKGYEYAIDNSTYTKVYNNVGEVITWNNPLISNDILASNLEGWLDDYYLGQVSYDIPWRGDPRVDANDLFYVETANRGIDLIRIHQNELKFNGAWSGNMKGRVADLQWQ